MAIVLAEDARYPERKETRDRLAALLHPDSSVFRQLPSEVDGDVLPDPTTEMEDELSPFPGLAPPMGV